DLDPARREGPPGAGFGGAGPRTDAENGRRGARGKDLPRPGSRLRSEDVSGGNGTGLQVPGKALHAARKEVTAPRLMAILAARWSRNGHAARKKPRQGS